ncbi:hypothetical protein BN000_04728 [Neobacillus massiliamazoniensis]|uniref:Uncharacterized protein n=1 Tax=Neobacillus massiliamazoniensis TaxID=1499688 RepID=A0A0U1P3J5_9BACI|nr:hypothetical protein BN000_04728 [Neobacillus massiliamazoniensis]
MFLYFQIFINEVKKLIKIVDFANKLLVALELYGK